MDYIGKCVLIFQINAPSKTIATEVEFKVCSYISYEGSVLFSVQVFGIQLAAHVIGQYPVPEAMGIAKNIIQ